MRAVLMAVAITVSAAYHFTVIGTFICLFVIT